MKDTILNLLKNSTNDFTYEIDLKTKEITWHKDINLHLKYPDTSNLLSIDNFIKILDSKSQETFEKKILNLKDETYQEVSLKIKDSENNYKQFINKYIFFKSSNEKKILGVMKDINYETKLSKHLEEPEKRIDNIIDSTDDLIFYKDINFIYMGCNEAFCNFVGLKKDEIIGKNDFEIFPEEFAQLFRTMDIKMLENKKTRTNKEWVKFPNNKDVLLLTQKSPLINKKDEIYGLLGISRDITKEVEYENRIKESKESYKQLFEANKIPVLLISLESGKIIKGNKAAVKFYGYTKKELKKLCISQINTLPKKAIEKEMKKAKDEKRDCFFFKHKLKNGKIIDVEVYSGPTKYNGKTILYSLVFDISKRRLAEKKLMQAHTIYQNTKEGIFITNLKGHILSVNKAFEDITGYKEEEVLNKKVSILKSDSHDKNFYENMWTSLLTKGTWEGEIINRTKKGKDYPQWLTINAVYDHEHKPSKYVAVFTDFTKLKEQEDMIRQKDHIMYQQSKMAAMGEMLRNIAHQWRQPLSVISSSATGLKLKKEFGMLNDDDFVEFADGILKSSHYLSDTIEDFTNYFKNNNDESYFHIKEVIDKVFQLIEASMKNSDIEIEVDIKDDVEILGIKNELIQVILNLINNSKDAFKNVDDYLKMIQITVYKELENLIICIQDNAGGIKEDIIDKIFAPYFTTKHQSQGTGIGLYMAQEIIQNRLEGTITVKNINHEIDKIEYKGAQFKITIPTRIES